MRAYFFAMVIFLPALSQSQDFSGRWTGYCMDSVSQFKQILSLNLSSPDSLLSGVIHWYYPATQAISDFSVNGQFHMENEKILLFENDPGGKNSEGSDSGANVYYRLQYQQAQGKEILQGYVYRMTSGESGGEKLIRLERKTGKFIPLPPIAHKHHSDSTQRKNEMVAVNERVSPVVAQIPVEDDSVKIRLFDNGEIDGDSVALYFNNRLVIQHLKLKAEAKVIFLPVDKSLPVNRVLLVAENLGSMPPNTALMEITSHEKIYNLFLSTDYHQNAMVEFILKNDFNKER